MTQVVSFECYRWYHLSDIIKLDYYTSLYAKISTCGDEFVQYNLNINDISGLYQQIMAACDVNDELTNEKIHAIAKEADRLWVLFVLNGIYDSNDFQDVSYLIIALKQYRLYHSNDTASLAWLQVSLFTWLAIPV